MLLADEKEVSTRFYDGNAVKVVKDGFLFQFLCGVEEDGLCRKEAVQERTSIVGLAHGALEGILGIMQPFLKACLMDGDATLALAALDLKRGVLEADIARHGVQMGWMESQILVKGWPF